MNYRELIKNHGDMVGKKVWICDYRHNDIAQKPIRHIKPTEALIVSNDDLPKNKSIYYGKTHFRAIGKKGSPLKQIIAPYDNTGFKSYPGESINIFVKQEDCVNHYIEHCKIVKSQIEEERERANKRFDDMTDEVDKTLRTLEI